MRTIFAILGALALASCASLAPTPKVAAPAPVEIAYQCVTNYYVATTGSDAANGKTSATAWKTINHAEAALSGSHPGACINAAPGTYAENPNLYMGGNVNSVTGYGVLRCATKANPPKGVLPVCKILGPGGSNVNSIVTMIHSYEIIDSFDVSTSNAKGQEEGVGGDLLGETNCDGPGDTCHHLAVYNSYIHDLGGGGVNLANGEAFYVQGNLIVHTASRKVNQESGISLCCQTQVAFAGPLDGALGTQGGVPIYNLVADNVAHDNVIGASVKASHTDGEGIIIDTLSNQQSNCANQNKFGTLIEGNDTYRNGGSGISVFFSSYVLVRNNTARNDNLDKLNPGTERGELNMACGHDVTWENNTATAIPGAGVTAANNAAVSGTAGQAASQTNVLWTGNTLSVIGKGTNGVVAAFNGDKITAPPNTIQGK